MKQLVSISLCVLMLFTGFGKSVLLLNYELNKKNIASTKCENRDKPQMQCNGKCYLSKQLKKAEEKETALPNFNNIKELSPFLTAETSSIRFVSVKGGVKAQLSPSRQLPIEACPGSIFQPPEYIA